MDKQYYVYILASKRNGTLYIGVTFDLIKRVYEHKNNINDNDTFTEKYSVHNLVYYEQTENVESAIQREKDGTVYSGYPEENVTHWMPLPEPPKFRSR